MTSKDITPKDSACPVFLQPWTADEIAVNDKAEKRRIKYETSTATAKAALLAKLGITADEARLLLA